jgi:hypothetical protein
MRVAFIACAAAVLFAAPVMGQAQTVSVCGQKVEYAPTTPEAGVDPKAREALGV